MRVEQRRSNPQPVTRLSVEQRGRPLILLELDSKLHVLKYLIAVQVKGGVVNIRVVRAATQALIASNPALAQQFARFEMPHSLMGLISIQKTGIYQESWYHFQCLTYEIHNIFSHNNNYFQLFMHYNMM